MMDNEMAVEESTGAGQKKTMLVAGGLAVALGLGAAGYLLMSGGSSEEDYSVPVRKAPKTATAAKAKAATLKSVKPTTAKLPAASSVRIGRDPFSALYMVPAKPAGGAAGATGTDTAAKPGTTDVASEPYVIVLTKVTKDPGGAKLFTFTIGKDSKTVLPAQRFGTYGELVVLSWVENAKKVITGAVLQVGDDDPIIVPIGVKTSVL